MIKRVLTLCALILICVCSSQADALEVHQPFDSIKAGQWVRYEISTDAYEYEVIVTHVIEAMDDNEVWYRTTNFRNGGFESDHRIRFPIDLFRRLADESYEYAWEENKPVDTEIGELDGVELELTVFKFSLDVLEEIGGGTIDHTIYRSKDIPVSGLFRQETINADGDTWLTELLEYGNEIDEDAYPEIIPEDDPIDVTEGVVEALRMAMEAGD